MEPKNYMLGNFVEFDKGIGKITTIENEYVKISNYFKRYHYSEIKPIKTTPKYLKKLGFVKDKHINYRWYYFKGEILFLTYDIDDAGIELGDYWHFKKQEYVHQLQNLLTAII